MMQEFVMVYNEHTGKLRIPPALSQFTKTLLTLFLCIKFQVLKRDFVLRIHILYQESPPFRSFVSSDPLIEDGTLFFVFLLMFSFFTNPNASRAATARVDIMCPYNQSWHLTIHNTANCHWTHECSSFPLFLCET